MEPAEQSSPSLTAWTRPWRPERSRLNDWFWFFIPKIIACCKCGFTIGSQFSCKSVSTRWRRKGRPQPAACWSGAWFWWLELPPSTTSMCATRTQSPTSYPKSGRWQSQHRLSKFSESNNSGRLWRNLHPWFLCFGGSIVSLFNSVQKHYFIHSQNEMLNYVTYMLFVSINICLSLKIYWTANAQNGSF